MTVHYALPLRSGSPALPFLVPELSVLRLIAHTRRPLGFRWQTGWRPLPSAGSPGVGRYTGHRFVGRRGHPAVAAWPYKLGRGEGRRHSGPAVVALKGPKHLPVAEYRWKFFHRRRTSTGGR